jgi:hypothetical protein
LARYKGINKNTYLKYTIFEGEYQMVKYSEQKIVEILENKSYCIEVLNNSKIIAKKTNQFPIIGLPDPQSKTGWIFNVGKNKLTLVYDAIVFSERQIIQ